MTARQAISVLKRLRTPYNADAVDMAVDALRLVPELVRANAEMMEEIEGMKKPCLVRGQGESARRL